MHHYLEFMDECERLKDLFLLEAEDDSEGGDDLAEMEPDESGDDSKEKSGDDSGETSDDSSDESSDDGLDGDTDLNLDSDLGDITGDDTLEPEADEVNAEEKPGAVNPQTLYQEVTQGEDNIYDRTAKAALEKFPGGKCEVKDMLPIIAIGIKSYMKNKNYAPIPKIDMKKLVFRIAHDIHDMLSGKKASSSKASTESAFYLKDSKTLMEGWKELALAGAIASAPMAGHAATAESAPYATHAGTSKIITNNRPISQDSRETMNARENYGGSTGISIEQNAKSGKQEGKTSVPAKEGAGSSDVPVVSDYSKVYFDSNTTYQVTPEQLDKMKAAGNIPAKYQVLDSTATGKTASTGAGTGKKTGKTASVTQSAAKQQAKAGTESPAKSAAPSGTCKVSSSNCGCGGDDGDFDTAVHNLGHKAVDAGIRGVKTAWGGITGAVTGLWNGAKDAWNSSGKDIERDHDKMITKRKK